MQELKVYGYEVRIGDLLRFRMSKHDPVRWLPVERIEPSETGKRVIVSGPRWQEIVSKKEQQWVRREADSPAGRNKQMIEYSKYEQKVWVITRFWTWYCLTAEWLDGDFEF